jgi:uncharacterized protein YbjT (DUF2867 family)
MYAIMGATGQTGGATLAALRGGGAPIRAIMRDAERAAHLAAPDVTLVKADMGDVGSLTEAFSGAQAAYVLNPVGAQATDALAEAGRVSAAIAEAIRRAGLKHVVALSSIGAHLQEGSGVVRALHDFEAALRQTGVPTSFIRAANFMENWAELFGVASEHGVLPSMLQPLDRRDQTVSTGDVGATAAALLRQGPGGERIVSLVGPDEYSAVDVAALLSRLVDRTVTAVATPRAEWEPDLIAAGLGVSYAGELAALYDGINAGRLGFEPGIGEIRRGTVTLEQALRAALARGSRHG